MNVSGTRVSLAQEPDLVYSAGSYIARTFKAVSPRVPVVFVVSDDPVASGVVAAMNRPGGMFTGASMMSPELSGKRLELLAGAVPALARIAMLHEPEHRAAYPAEIPVEQPTHVALIVNLRTARALGLALPQPLLLRADEVIE